MDKHPKEMTNKELFKKLKEDGVNTKAGVQLKVKDKYDIVYFR